MGVAFEQAPIIGTEINNYRIKQGVVLDVVTVNVVGRAIELLPFFTIIKGEISEKGEVLIKKHFDKKNDGKEAIDSIILPTEFYQLRNMNNEIMFVTDLRGVLSIYEQL
mgnify:CR=1 FL=1